MSKKLWLLSLSISLATILIAFIVTNANSKDKTSNEPENLIEEVNADSSYKEFDVVAEKYFIANIIGDYDTMKKYLPQSEIEKDSSLMNAKEGVVLNPEFKEMIKGRYKIIATDFYYQTHNQMFYYVEFFEPTTNNPHGLGIYGVKKKDGKYMIMNRYDSWIIGLQFKAETGKRGLVPSSLKKLMEKYPETVYEVNPQFK